MRAMLFRKEGCIFRAFFNYDVIFYIFRDIEDYLKNLSTRKVVLYNCKLYKTQGVLNMKTWFEKAVGHFIIFPNSTNSFYKDITVL